MKKIIAFICILFITGCDNAPATPDYFSKKLSDVELAYKEHPEDINKTDKYDTTPLITAIMYDRMDIAKFLINNKADLNYTPKRDYNNALGYAIGSKKDNAELIELLIKNGADINKQDSDGNTPILQALNKDINVKNVHTLLKYNPDINIKSDAGITPLCAFTVMNKDVSDTVNLLVKHGAMLNQTYDDNGQTCLMYAIHLDAHINNIKALIENGENVNLQSKAGFVALHEATDKRNIKVVKLLLDNKADVNLATKEGWTALMGLATNEKDTSSLIDLLLQHGANINQQDKDGATALSAAVDSGHINNIKALLKYNPNLDLYSSGYWPNLLIAIEKRNEEIVNLLLKQGANPNAKTDNGITALMVATKNQNYNIVKSLIDKGANIDEESKEVGTALSVACAYDNLDIVKYLINHGANVNFINSDKATPLVIAAIAGHLNIVQYLVEHGADVNYDMMGGNGLFGNKMTPLFKAIQQNNLEIAKYLVSQGANTDGLYLASSLSWDLDTMRYVASISTDKGVKGLKQTVQVCDEFLKNITDLIVQLPKDKQQLVAGSNYAEAARIYVYLYMIPESKRPTEFYGPKIRNKDLAEAFKYTINELEYRNLLFAQRTSESVKDLTGYFAKKTGAQTKEYFDVLLGMPLTMNCMTLKSYIIPEDD